MYHIFPTSIYFTGATRAGPLTVSFVKIWSQDFPKKTFMILHQKEFTFMVYEQARLDQYRETSSLRAA